MEAAHARCFHCGEPNPARSPWFADVDGARRQFCCAGCLAVAQTIGAAGLATYYALRQQTSASPRDDQASALEAAAAAAHLVDVDSNTREIALLVDDIRCGACIWLIETWLARQQGIREASVNFATRRARVRFDPVQTTVVDVLQAFARIGYHAHPYDPRRSEALARRESRALLLRAGLSLLGMMQVMMFAVPAYITVDGVDAEFQTLLNWASLVITVPVVLYCAAPFFVGAWRGLRAAKPGMDMPISLGVGGAFLASVVATLTGEGAVYYDSVTMFVALVLTARFIELQVRGKAAAAVESLARDVPQQALLVEYPAQSGEVRLVDASTLVAGQVVRVDAGAVIPADGVVLEGHSSVEEALLTGESWPRTKRAGDRVLAGSVNRASPLFVRVEAAGAATTLAALSRLVERAASHRPRIARLSDRIAMMFVAVLVGFAVVTGIVWWSVDPARVLVVTLAVLVVGCPCALSLATPAALASAAGVLSRRQVLCVRSDTLERLSRVTHVVLDKTGTLTTGSPRVVAVETTGPHERSLCLAIAAQLEVGSHHPFASALRPYAVARLSSSHVVAVTGSGVEGLVDGIRYRLGRPEWVQSFCRAPMPRGLATAPPAETPVVLASEHHWLACIRFGDELRSDARALVGRLRTLGLHASIVSGDREPSVAHIADMLGIEDWRADAGPEDKQRIIADLQRSGAIVAMIGDGINDAPSLAAADVSLTLGSAATLTRWTADAVVLGDRLEPVGSAFETARRTFRIIRQNFAWAIAYNIVAIPLAATGELSPLTAAIGMSVSSLVVVGNAWRLSRMHENGKRHRRVVASADADIAHSFATHPSAANTNG